MSNTREITVQGLTLVVGQPYAEGHVVTEAEAKALNQTRAENIRNNCAGKVRAKLKELNLEDADQLPEEVKVELLNEFTSYESDYTFTLANAGGGTRALDPVEKEAKKIATEILKIALAEAGRKIVKDDDFTEEHAASNCVRKSAFDEAVAKYMENPEVLKKAKKRVDEVRKQAAEALESLPG